MGKSAGKWIKTVLFGKKHSKSNLSKNVTPDKKTAVERPVEDLAANSPVISDPCHLSERIAENLEYDKDTFGSPCDSVVPLPVNQGMDLQSNIAPAPVSDTEMRRQEQAATKAQAAFRGYLARRAFRALKGIIRLQALIRGHLVRRQAVATLRCMHAIVKFQALARGRKVRLSDARPEFRKLYNMGELQVAIGTHSIFGLEKLARISFVLKLLVALPVAMPLSVQYDIPEPNSAYNWLERWSLSRFWEPPARTQKIAKAKPQRKQGGGQIVESEAGKSKRTTRKVSSGVNGENGTLTAFEMDKPKRNPRKVTSHLAESVLEQPQNELERVKRNLRKVSASAVAVLDKSETETEKPQPLNGAEKVANAAHLDVTELEIAISFENPAASDGGVDKEAFHEPRSKMTMDDPVDVPHDALHAVEAQSSENGEKTENTQSLDDGSSCKEELSGKENQKMRKRRSLPAKQDYPENISHNSPSLPSYMAATESAKAKLRAQGASKFGEDGAGYGFVRRHSLPISTKLISLSPRIQKPVQANGKGASKTNRPLTSSRDDKALQLGWRR